MVSARLAITGAVGIDEDSTYPGKINKLEWREQSRRQILNTRSPHLSHQWGPVTTLQLRGATETSFLPSTESLVCEEVVFSSLHIMVHYQVHGLAFISAASVEAVTVAGQGDALLGQGPVPATELLTAYTSVHQHLLLSEASRACSVWKS